MIRMSMMKFGATVRSYSMANFDFSVDDSFFGELLKTDIDELCKGMLKDCAPTLVESMKKAVDGAIRHKDESTGELVKSIKARTPSKCKTGGYLVYIGPSGYSKNYYDRMSKTKKQVRKYEMSNAFKLIIMEYGLHGQPATPSMEKSIHAASNKITDLMQEYYNKKVGG